MGEYAPAAEYYDLLYSDVKDYAAEAELLAGLIRDAMPHAARLLDVACGSGEHARALSAIGFEVDGVDLEPAFVAQARAKCPGGRFVVGDMTTLDLERLYDVALCLFSAIGYALTVVHAGRDGNGVPECRPDCATSARSTANARTLYRTEGGMICNRASCLAHSTLAMHRTTCAILTVLATAAPLAAQDAAVFEVHEATIGQMHDAMRAGRVTARQLVDAYLARISAYDRRGPSLNSLIVIHPRARQIADSLDALYARTNTFVGPLHGIPIIVKDNYDTFDLPTTAGSASLADSLPPRDATMVEQLRAAGAIVLAKSNMAEFAFSPVETIGSALPGYTFNPYALNRVPAGSSGGTAAAVAANLGAAGLGTDTGNSIRGPSSHTALVGIRPTIGLTSRAGIVPLFLERDVGGPMARTVADAALLLDVLAGTDPRDPATADAALHIPPTYTDFLDADALRGARIGVARSIANREDADAEVLQRFDEAIADLRAAGAIIVDPVALPFMDSIRPRRCSGFRRDLEAYLATRGEAAPYRTLEAILESGDYHASIERRMRNAMNDSTAGDPERCAEAAASVAAYYEGLRSVLAGQDLDAVVYPTWSNPARLVGDLDSPAGDNSQAPVPAAGVPAITVPMGWVRDGSLPVGLQIMGDRWSEARLIALAYAYEQATHHRRPPASAPPLR